MVHTRVNVYAGDDWADPVLWYAHGVKAMQARALDDRTSWRFWGAMHGYDAPLWQALGYVSPGEPKPSRSTTAKFWKQCQHGSWYFLPWHRGYLLAFEKMVRAAVVEQGGPADWALPYWNPFVAHEAKLPPAFRSPSWPGHGRNPLYVDARYGPRSDGDVFVPIHQVNLNALLDAHYTGVSTGGSTGFGGVDTGFSHGGQVHGGIETQPHDWVHGLVGGGDPNTGLPGLMSDPDTAGLDPIFWLHHANIDRLWESWTHQGHTDPTNPAWLGGPAAAGGRSFVAPRPDGSTFTYTPADVVSIHALGYKYDTLSPAGAPPAPVARAASSGGAASVSGTSEPELIGATTGSVEVAGDGVSSHVRLDGPARRRAAHALSTRGGAADLGAGVGGGGEEGSGERVFLNLENVRGTSDATAFQVYVGLGPDDDPDAHPELLAGSIAPFGLRKASQADGEHAGQGLTFVLDITDVAQRLHLADSFDVDELPVRLVPVSPVRSGAEVTVGRISIYRHAAEPG